MQWYMSFTKSNYYGVRHNIPLFIHQYYILQVLQIFGSSISAVSHQLNLHSYLCCNNVHTSHTSMCVFTQILMSVQLVLMAVIRSVLTLMGPSLAPVTVDIH